MIMELISSQEINEMLLNRGFTRRDNWYTYPDGKSGSNFAYAASSLSKTFPELPEITQSRALEIIDKAKGYRLDIAPPSPDDFGPGVKAAMSLPPGEIILHSQAYQRATTMLDVAAFSKIFEYRKYILNKQFPFFKKLPCAVWSAVNPVVDEIYEGAIKMGRAINYPCFASPRVMLDYVHLGPGCTVIQFDNLYECWIIPSGNKSVWAKNLGDPNGTGNLDMCVRVRIRNIENIIVGFIV
jgi:hypothetical protein